MGKSGLATGTQFLREITMQILKPVTLSTNDISFTNATTNTTYDPWIAGTYSSGEKRYVGMTLYEVALTGTNTTTNDPTISKDWKTIGNIDPYQCFDGRVGTLTISSGTNSTMAFETDTSQLINSAAFLNMDAQTMTLTVTDAVEGLVYSHSETLLQDVDNWYQYFFYPYEQKTDVVLDDLPTYPGAAIRLELARPTGTVSIGEIVLGRQRFIGQTQFGASAGIMDYSRKTTDEFGNFVIEERPFSKRAEFDVQIDIEQFDSVYRFLTSIRATPCVFIGDVNRPSLIVYGFARSFDQVLANTAITSCTLSVEGL
jgi:hypothetical protein